MFLHVEFRVKGSAIVVFFNRDDALMFDSPTVTETFSSNFGLRWDAKTITSRFLGVQFLWSYCHASRSLCHSSSFPHDRVPPCEQHYLWAWLKDEFVSHQRRSDKLNRVSWIYNQTVWVQCLILGLQHRSLWQTKFHEHRLWQFTINAYRLIAIFINFSALPFMPNKCSKRYSNFLWPMVSKAAERSNITKIVTLYWSRD